MGKSKKRSLNKSSTSGSFILKRNDVIIQIVNDIRNNSINDNTIKYISLFGVRSEELTEYGINYEELFDIKNLLS